jgi:biotin carboxyl carrier protein
MYKVSTENGEYNIGFTHTDSTQPLINAVFSGYTIHGNVMDGFSIEKDGKIFHADLLKVDFKEKTFLIKVNGRRIPVKAQDRFDLLLSKLGMTGLASKKINQLKSPMPGLILEILVEPGQQIKAGEPVMILEAMKMENIIKAPVDVVIKNIKAIKGRPVEKNELLIEFE